VQSLGGYGISGVVQIILQEIYQNPKAQQKDTNRAHSKKLSSEKKWIELENS